MRSLLKRYAIITVVTHVMQLIVPSFTISGNFHGFFVATVILFLAHTLVRPLMNLLLLPLNILTMNLSGWILNILLISLWIFLLPSVSLGSWEFPGLFIGPVSFSSTTFPLWQTAIIFSIIMVLLSEFARWLFR